MVMIPAGEFIMGSPADEAERSNDESPQRSVTIAKPFAVGKCDVASAKRCDGLISCKRATCDDGHLVRPFATPLDATSTSTHRGRWRFEI